MVTSLESQHSTPPPEQKRFLEAPLLLSTMTGVVALFGAIHFIPWTSAFPTVAERWLWRVSAILITGGPILIVFQCIIGNWVTNPVLKSIFRTSAFTLILPAYIVSRIILIILPLIILRSLPPTALLELKWSEILPHI